MGPGAEGNAEAAVGRRQPQHYRTTAASSKKKETHLLRRWETLRVGGSFIPLPSKSTHRRSKSANDQPTPASSTDDVFVQLERASAGSVRRLKRQATKHNSQRVKRGRTNSKSLSHLSDIEREEVEELFVCARRKQWSYSSMRGRNSKHPKNAVGVNKATGAASYSSSVENGSLDSAKQTRSSEKKRFSIPTDKDLHLLSRMDNGWCSNISDRNSGLGKTLQESEWTHIYTALKKAEACDTLERRRLGLLVKEAEELKLQRKVRANKENQCHNCSVRFSGIYWMFSIGLEMCCGCQKYVCRNTQCMVEIKSRHGGTRWVCRLCYKMIEIWTKGGVWFHRTLPEYDIVDKETMERLSPFVEEVIEPERPRILAYRRSAGASNLAPTIEKFRRTGLHTGDTSPVRSSKSPVRSSKSPVSKSRQTSKEESDSLSDGKTSPPWNTTRIRATRSKTISLGVKSRRLTQPNNERPAIGDLRSRSWSTSGDLPSVVLSTDVPDCGMSPPLTDIKETEKGKSFNKKLVAVSVVQSAIRLTKGAGTGMKPTSPPPQAPQNTRGRSPLLRQTPEDKDDVFPAVTNIPGGEIVAARSPRPVESESTYLGSIDFTILYESHMEELHVTIVQCKDLTAMDFHGASDPFVRLQLLPYHGLSKGRSSKYQTSIKKRTLNPVYEEEFTYYGIEPTEVQHLILRLTVYDHDTLTANDFLGEVVFRLQNVQADMLLAYNRMLELSPQLRRESVEVSSIHVRGLGLGKLLVSLCYLSAEGKLRVGILRAASLPAVDVISKSSDPYVKCYLLPDERKTSKRRTAVHKRTLNPVFNEYFTYEIDAKSLMSSTLEISIWDYNYASKNTFIGSVELCSTAGPEVSQWLDALCSPNEQFTAWHSLKPRRRFNPLAKVTEL